MDGGCGGCGRDSGGSLRLSRECDLEGEVEARQTPKAACILASEEFV